MSKKTRSTTLTVEDWRALAHIAKAASKDDKHRPILAAVLIEAEGDTVRAVASDSYKMATTEVEAEAGTWTALLSAKDVLEALAVFERTIKRKVKPGDQPEVHLQETGDGFRVSLLSPATQTVSLAIEEVDGKFPNWRPLIGTPPGEVQPPSKFQSKPKAQIVDYLRAHGVRPADTETKAQLLTSVRVVYDRPTENVVALDPHILAELLASHPRKQIPVKLHMYGTLRPVWVTIPVDPAWRGLIMPVRI